MATLEKIRNKAGLLILVVGLALLAFILGDFLNSGSTFWRQSQEIVINVNGEKIGYFDYQKRIDEMVEVYKMQSGNQNLPEELHGQIRESVYQTMVQEIILEQTAKKLGITVTSDEVIDMVVGDNPAPAMMQSFINPETGEFDKVFALNFVKAMEDEEVARTTGLNPETLNLQRAYWEFMKRNLKTERLRAKITTLLSQSHSNSELEAKASFERDKTTADFAYVMQSYSAIADSLVTVSDAELKKVYDQRKEMWKHDGERTADLVVVDILPSEEDINAVELEINKIKDEFASSANVGELVSEYSDMPYLDFYLSADMLDPDMREFATTAGVGDVNGPFLKDNTYRMMRLLSKKTASDSVKVAIIVVGEEIDDTKAALSDSLMAVLNKGGSFETLAREFSQDQTAQQGGEMGWFTEGSALNGVSAEFKDLIFSASVNKAQPFNLRGRLFIVKVLEKTAAKEMFKVGDVVMNVSPSSRTQTALYNKLNQFIAQNRDINTFSQMAADSGYNVIPGISVTASSQSVYNLKATRPIVRWAFGAKKGAISDVFECEDKFVVAALKGISEKGYRPFSEMKDVLAGEMLKEKKGEKIAANMKEMAASALDEYGRLIGSKVDSVEYVSFSTVRLSGIGVEPKLNAAATTLPLNELSAPIAGNNGVYIIKVYNRNERSTPFDAAAEATKLAASWNPQMIAYQLMQILRNGSDIEDNRIRFY